MLGEYLEENCPDVTVKVVIKSNEDWGEYIDSVSVYSSHPNGYINVDIDDDRSVELTVSTSAPARSSTPWKVSRSAMELTLSSTSVQTTVAPASQWSRSSRTPVSVIT